MILVRLKQDLLPRDGPCFQYDGKPVFNPRPFLASKGLLAVLSKVDDTYIVSDIEHDRVDMCCCCTG